MAITTYQSGLGNRLLRVNPLINFGGEITPIPQSLSTAQNFTRASDATGRDGVEVGTNVARQEPLQFSPWQWASLSTYALARITDGTLLTHANLVTELATLSSTYPNELTVDVAGVSEQSRDIHCVRLWDDGGKPIVGISCCIHGNESESLRGYLAAIDWLANNTPAIIKTNLTVYWWPMLNPDGVTAATRENANSVNLNRNFPYFFDSAPDTDKGTTALDQAETSVFTTYMNASGRVGRCIGWLDIHSWSSKTTFGFLNEQIHHTHRQVNFNRALFHHANALIDYQNYTEAANPPVAFTEYRSKRKPYLYTWVQQNAQTDCWAGIYEHPTAETNQVNASMGQDIALAFVYSGAQIESTERMAVVSEQGTQTVLNSNPHLTSWVGSESRPSFFSGSKVRFTQLSDPALSRNVIEMKRPDAQSLPQAIKRFGYAVKYDVNGNATEFVQVAGSTGSYSQTVQSIDLNTGTITTESNYGHTAQYLAASTDGTDFWGCGGYNGVYKPDIWQSQGSLGSLTWRNNNGSTVYYGLAGVYTTGVQRHHMVYDSNTGYFVVTGGRDSGGYRNLVVLMDPADGHCWIHANMNYLRGYHVSAMYGTDLYVFGGFGGVTYRDNIERIAISNSKVGTGTDGTGNGTTTFTNGANYTFTGADVGRQLTIPNTANAGTWTINGVTDGNTVTLSGTVGTGINYPYVISAAAIGSTTISEVLPTAVRGAMIGHDGGDIGYIFGGRSDGSTVLSSLIEFNFSTETATNIAYTMDEEVDEETDTIVPLETPVLENLGGYYAPNDNSLVIIGGEDEGGTHRGDIYDYDIEVDLMGIWGVELNTYGWVRMNQVFNGVAGDHFTIMALLQNKTAINDDYGTYCRININIGPLSAITRKVRTWYQVPATGEYETFMVPLELEAGETEFRCYIRLYTAGTLVWLAGFAVLDDRTPFTYMPPVSLTKADEDLSYTVTPDALLDKPSTWTLSGAFSPMMGVNIEHADTPVLEFYNDVATKLFTLSFLSATNGSADYATLDNGTFRVTDHINVTTTDLTAFPVQHNRSSGKEMRYDVVAWQLVKAVKVLTLKLNHYGEELSFDVSNLGYAEVIRTIKGLNAIHLEPDEGVLGVEYNPVASPDSDTVSQGGIVDITVSDNDAVYGSTLDLASIAIPSSPAHGGASPIGGGVIRYDHNGTDNFTDSFTYTIDDVRGYTSNAATVSMTIIPASFAYYEAARTMGPNGYWRLGESSGPTINDELNLNDGTYNGTPTFAQTSLISSETDSSVIFGSLDYGAVPDGSEFDITSGITCACWIKRNGHDLTAWGHGILGQSKAAGDERAYNLYTYPGTETLCFSVSTDGTYQAANNWVGTHDALDNNPHLVVAVMNPGTYTRLYVDGVIVDEWTSSIPTSLFNSPADLWIGLMEADSVKWTFNGNLDDPMVLGHVLSFTDVNFLYLMGTGSDGDFRTVNMAQKPVGYWRLGEPSGTTASDETSASHDGTYQGTPTLGVTSLVPSESDTAATFSTLDYVSVPDHADFDITGAVTLTAWIKRNGTHGSGNNRGVLGKWLGSGNQRSYDMYVQQGTGYLSMAISTDGTYQAGNDYVGNHNVLDNVAHHVVAVFEPSTSARLYVDGVQVNSWTSSIPASVYASTQDVWVGMTFAASTLNAFDGTIDEPKVIDRALSSQEVAMEYAAGLHGVGTYAFANHRLNPIGYWRLGESSGTTAFDETGNNIDGTFTSGMEGSTGALTNDSDTCFTWLTGSDQVDLGTGLNALTDGAAELSISGWIWFTTIPGGDNQGRILMRNDSGYMLYYYRQNSGEHGLYYLLPGITSTLANSPKIPTGNLSTGVWHHVVGTYDGSVAKIYLDGTLRDTKTGLTGTIAVSAVSTMLGVTSSGGNYRHSGNMDEVAIYTRSLSAGEIKMLYDKGLDIF